MKILFSSLRVSATRRVARVGVFAFLLTAVAGLVLSAADQTVTKEQSTLEQQLLGTWVLVGTPGDVGEVPARGGTLAFRTGTRWTEVAVHARSGLASAAHGGTYRITGDEYEETVDYGSGASAPWIGKTYRWKVKVEGDTMTRIGIGNPWTHVWKRVK